MLYVTVLQRSSRTLPFLLSLVFHYNLTAVKLGLVATLPVQSFGSGKEGGFAPKLLVARVHGGVPHKCAST